MCSQLFWDIWNKTGIKLSHRVDARTQKDAVNLFHSCLLLLPQLALPIELRNSILHTSFYHVSPWNLRWEPLAEAPWDPPLQQSVTEGSRQKCYEWMTDACHRNPDVINNRPFGICTCVGARCTPARPVPPVLSPSKGQPLHSRPQLPLTLHKVCDVPQHTASLTV